MTVYRTKMDRKLTTQPKPLSTPHLPPPSFLLHALLLLLLERLGKGSQSKAHQAVPTQLPLLFLAPSLLLLFRRVSGSSGAWGAVRILRIGLRLQLDVRTVLDAHVLKSGERRSNRLILILWKQGESVAVGVGRWVSK